VQRQGDTVRRPLAPWSSSVHELLAYLEGVDFPASRLLGVEDGCEVLAWIDGDSGKAGWSRIVPEHGVRTWGRFLRSYHDAVRAYRPGADRTWSSGRGACADGELVCHGDFGPWNAVWRDDVVVGLLDWDHAGPAPVSFDLAYALEYVAPFRPNDVSIRDMAHERPPDRARRIEAFCEGYGVDVPTDPVSLVADQQRQTMALVARLAADGLEPQATWVREGYLIELADRVRFTEGLQL
jgi:Ser/Thr protein kinase RdoA (MazF antagonist)